MTDKANRRSQERFVGARSRFARQCASCAHSSSRSRRPALRPEEAQRGFRVAQEAVRNIGRYSHARHATVELAASDDGRNLTVADDGVGFDVEGLAKRRRDGHLGLVLLKSLAQDGGAQLRIVSAPGEGTRLELTIP